MGTETYRAHCGACAGLMALIHRSGSGIWRYRCQDCGLTTAPRATVKEADADAVWVEVQPPPGDIMTS